MVTTGLINPNRPTLTYYKTLLDNDNWDQNPASLLNLGIVDSKFKYFENAIEFATISQIENAFLYFGRYPNNEDNIYNSLANSPLIDDYDDFLINILPRTKPGFQFPAQLEYYLIENDLSEDVRDVINETSQRLGITNPLDSLENEENED